MTIKPPRASTKADASDEKNSTIGMYSAFKDVARTEARYMSVEISRKSAAFFSSITSVFEVLAPVMPSLNAPVIVELIRRMRRFKFKILRWKTTVSTAINGTTEMTSSAIFQFRISMEMNTPQTYAKAHSMS